MDFSQEELFEVVDRLVTGLLERAGIVSPPVDALHIAEEHLGIPVVEYESSEEDDDPPRPRPRIGSSAIAITPGMSRVQRHKAAAEGIGRALLPEVLRKLDVPAGSENKQFAGRVRDLVASRLLVPTRFLRAAIRECRYDLPALKERFTTATSEAIALRFLDLDEPCVISIVDDGIVAVRRGNHSQPGKKLVAPEQTCHDRVAELEQPHRVRADNWTIQGWPVSGRGFRRIILHAVPDEV
jgi:hypothetical protein